MILSSALVVAAALLAEVAAHGYVPQIKIGDEYIHGWDVSTGKRPLSSHER